MDELGLFTYGHSDSKTRPSEIGAMRLGNEVIINLVSTICDSPLNQEFLPSSFT